MASIAVGFGRKEGAEAEVERLPYSAFDAIQETCLGPSPNRFAIKLVSVFFLAKVAGWPLSRIGILLGHPKGHVCRLLKKAEQLMESKKEELAKLISPEITPPSDIDETGQ